MSRERTSARAAGFVLALLFAACGSDGERGSDPAPADPGTPTPGVIDPGSPNVFGKVFLGTVARPALDHEIWIVDHTAPGYTRHLIADDGTFSEPVTRFITNHVYTFHVVKDLRLLADVDLAPSTAGTQSALRYAGGYGFNMGEVVVPLTRGGEIDTAAASPPGLVGGGFSLVMNAAVTLDRYPLPPLLSRLDLGGSLVVLDPATLLHAFYLRSANPTLYAQELASHARLRLQATSIQEGELTRVVALEGGSWLPTARLALNDESDYSGAPLWSTTSFDVKAIDAKSFEASVYPGQRLAPSPLLIVKAQPDDGPQLVVPRVARPLVGLPPLLTAIAANGGVPAAIDYASTTATNGLTRPFCQTGAVTMTLAAPLDLAGIAIPGATLELIDVYLDYYGIVDGKTTKLVHRVADLPAAYQSAFEDPAVSDVTRSWSPTEARFRFARGTTSQVAPTVDVRIPAELMLNGVDGAGVFRTRMRVYFRSATGAAEAGVAIWLKRPC